MEDFAKQEQLVDQYVEQGNVQAAVRLLYDLIVQYARSKNFTKAEGLREKLFDVDSMALQEIIKSGEIIEQEKNESIGKDHLQVWQDLYNSLSTDEGNALYYAMKESVYELDQTVFRQGEVRPNLYFVDEGELKIVYGEGDRETLITTLASGDIIGEEGFFSNSVCTVSMITLSHARLRLLEKEILKKWGNDFPAIECKLHEYCRGRQKLSDLLKKNRHDRRGQNRIIVSWMGIIQLLNPGGVSTGKAFKGELLDISIGGLSFTIRILQKEAARLLMGRRLSVKFDIPHVEEEPAVEVSQAGTVVGVRLHMYGDYSIHVKFDTLFSKQVLEDLMLASKREQENNSTLL
ncbi:MAG: cyclic nucleotide-binding domain-containing protein [Pseudomonadota bacterium]